jgi:hypothetical protein
MTPPTHYLADWDSEVELGQYLFSLLFVALSCNDEDAFDALIEALSALKEQR